MKRVAADFVLFTFINLSYLSVFCKQMLPGDRDWLHCWWSLCSGEVNSAGETVVVAKGGRGGDPRNGFQGQKGEALNITLDLKLVADIGLVG